jgi:hypothetical protein
VLLSLRPACRHSQISVDRRHCPVGFASSAWDCLKVPVIVY